MSKNQEKAIEMMKEALMQTDLMKTKKRALHEKWGPSYGNLMYKSEIKGKAERFVAEKGADLIVALPKIDEFKLSFNENLKENDLLERKIPNGHSFYFYDDKLSIKFIGEEITVSQMESIIFTCESVDELIEKVSIDMRTKKFKNVLKRRSKEKYCKETEKIDMRKKDFKETMNRKFKREQRKLLKAEIEESRVDGEETVLASLTYNTMQEIIGLMKDKKDFKKLLMACKSCNLNPIPLKREINSEEERFKINKTFADVAYVIQNAGNYLKIAEKLFDEEDDSEPEK